MNNFQSKVLEFQRASGQPVSDTPRTLTKEEADFRDTLLREEIKELQYAIVDDNRVEILDALCDIKYVNDGTANMIGFTQRDDFYWNEYEKRRFKITEGTAQGFIDTLPYDSIGDADLDWVNSVVFQLAFFFGFSAETFRTALDRVHESNMSKFCDDIKTAERTQEFYKKQGIDTYVEPVEKRFVIYREGDGKVLKSVEYHPVYLEDLADE